jgi:preprotein translocase subunit SecE
VVWWPITLVFVRPSNGVDALEASGEGAPEGNSSIGRASVSKTEGWGFKSLLPCRLEAQDHGRKGRSVADKEEVEPAAEPSSAELSGASQTSADVKASPIENGDTGKSNGESAKVLEPAGVAATTSDTSAKTDTRRPAKAAKARGPKGAPTNKRDQVAKRERTTPLKFVAQSIGELRKVVYPTGPQLINYFVVVLVFVLFVIAYVSLLDLGFGWAIFKIFS